MLPRWTLCSLLLAPGAVAETLELANGDALSGLVTERSAERVVLEHPVLGRLEIPTSALAPPPAPDAGAFGTGWLRDWERRFELGVSGASGNSNDQKIQAGLELGYEDEHARWNMDARYYRSSSDGDADAHEAHASLEHDWLLPPSRWFGFASGRYDWDAFEDWDFRLGGFGGVGYGFFDSDHFVLRGRAGLGLTREFGTGEDVTPEALLGLESEWKLDDRQTLRAYNRLFPAFAEPGEFRNLTGLDYTVRMNDILSLRMALDNEYESEVDREAERNDLTYRGSVVLDF
jgi:putative salt-induced outer membrane protein YdiY